VSEETRKPVNQGIGEPARANTPGLDGLLEKFVEECLNVFGRGRVECIVLHGSALKGGAIAGFSDIDLVVFLAAECFDADGNLPDELAFEAQRRLGPLPSQEHGLLYHQVMFYEASRYPRHWAGIVPGAHRMLWGTAPRDLMATAGSIREAALKYLRDDLPLLTDRDVQDFAGAPDHWLSGRVRLLGTRITPAVFSLAAMTTDNPIAVWGLSKFEALGLLEERYSDESGPHLARRFYENVVSLYGHAFDNERARETFRLGVRFLRWAESKGQELTSETSGRRAKR
jgi:predicted nucleotidyltransferase